MNTTEERKTQLFDKMYSLEIELENNPSLDAELDLAEAKDEYAELCRVDCLAERQHFIRTTSSGGYDVCLNCGGKS